MKKDIAIIVQKLNGGGAERTASNLSMILQDNYNVHLIVFDGTEIKYPYAGKLYDLKMPPASGKLGKLKNMFARVSEIKKIKRANNIIASISLMAGANLVNVMSKQNDRVITSVRNQMSQSRAKTKLQKIGNILQMKYIAQKSAYVVALSKGVEKDLVENFSVPQGKARTIYNPCDGEMLLSKAEVHAEKVSEMVEHSVITMGRLTEQKGQWHLIRAFKAVLESVPDAKLYILGEGPLEGKLKELVHDLQLDEHIIFLGFVEAPHAFIMKSQVFAFPSLFEGLGNVVLEALACGTPVVSTDCYSGPREILAPGTEVKEKLNEIEYAQFGILTSVGDKGQFEAGTPITVPEKQMADAIIELLVNDKIRKKYHLAALERIKDFSPESITIDWMRLIEG